MKLKSVEMFFRESPAKRFKGFMVEDVKTPLDLQLVVHRPICPVNGARQLGAESGEWHVSEYMTASRIPNVSEPKKLSAFNLGVKVLRDGHELNGIVKKEGRIKRAVDALVRRVLEEERGITDFTDLFIEVDCLTFTDARGRFQSWPVLNYPDDKAWFRTESSKIVTCGKKQYLKELHDLGWGRLRADELED